MRKYPFDRELAYGDFWPVYDWTWNSINVGLEIKLFSQLQPLAGIGEQLTGARNFALFLRDDLQEQTWPRWT